MQRDFIADLLYHIFSEEKKENPMPHPAKIKLFDKIKHWIASNRMQTEGE